MSTNENFCLKWRQFHRNIGDSFSILKRENDFCDVTLACGDDDQIEAHKVVLAACSPFFKTILRKQKHPHPFLYLRGIKKEDLVSIVDFIYNGEVNIAQENLGRFLSVAEELKLKGLTQSEELVNVNEDESVELDESKLMETNEGQTELDVDNIELDTPLKDDLHVDNIQDEIISMFSQIKADNYSLKQQSEGNTQDMILKDGSLWKCSVCGKQSKDKSNLTKHTEVHMGISHSCHSCAKIFNSKNSLHSHKWRAHRNQQV